MHKYHLNLRLNLEFVALAAKLIAVQIYTEEQGV